MNVPGIGSVRSAWHHLDYIPSVPRRVGVMGEWGLRKFEDRIIDGSYRRQGLDTSGPAFGRSHDPGESRGYVATDWRVLRKLFPPGTLGADDIVLELGSGKGRVAIWVASRFSVRRVIGVELDEEHVATARANLQRWRGPRQCTDVVFTCSDAQEFDVPDDVTVVYLFNPFMGDAFARSVERISESLARKPRPLRIIYFYPIMHDRLVEAGFRLDTMHRHPLYAWATYRVG